ncbi:non-ribosomal peptide synthetase [Pseudonocardia spinosispora]|uniref:non-ribosomal peptide synthetase n=1 Tax=Pseudonocardia spinosispora TaxID=103441 RepID=UPI0003F52DE2|nr:non-ribosomal peptide synthetase [Pseudonocardia spinosispora]
MTSILIRHPGAGPAAGVTDPAWVNDRDYPTLAAFWRGVADADTGALRGLFGESGTATRRPSQRSVTVTAAARTRLTGDEPILERLLAGVLLGWVLRVWTGVHADIVRVHVCAGECAAPVPVDVYSGPATPDDAPSVRAVLLDAHRTFGERRTRMRGCPPGIAAPAVLVSCADCPPSGPDTAVELCVPVPGRLVVRVSSSGVAGSAPEFLTGLVDVVAAAVLRAVCDPGTAVATVVAGAVRDAGLALSVLHGEHTEPGADLLELWERQVAHRPRAVAVIDGPRWLTYEQLDARSDAVATMLEQLGPRTRGPVAVTHDRGLAAVVAVLAAMKAGRVWVPVPPDLPHARRAEMIRATSAVAVLGPDDGLGLPAVPTDSVDADSVGADRARRRGRPAGPDADLCILFTSGSTGAPSGIRVSHGSVLNRLRWMWERHPWSASGRGVWLKSLGLVGSLWEVFGGLLTGHPTVIASMADLVDPARLWDLLDRHRVTRLLTSPPVLQLLLGHAQRPGVAVGRSLSLVTSSAEPLTTTLARAWLRRFPDHRLLNLYGLTECASNVAVADAAEQLDGAAQVSIGRPIDNCLLAVVDAAGVSLPHGIVGELAVGGRCVGAPLEAGGTARFGTDGSGAPLVRTGDLARLGPDGRIELLGRRDNQVKLRGHRIALEEVEAAVVRAGGAAEVVCGLVGDGSDAALVCWYTGAGDAHSALLEHCRTVLPSVMVPSRFVAVDAIPRLPGGKIDRAALHTLDTGRRGRSGRSDPAEGPLARALDDVEELVGHPVSPGDRLAGLDLHSLRMVELHERLRRWAPVEFDVVDLFRCATVSDVALLTVGTAEQVAGRGVERAGRYRAALARGRRGRTGR